MFRILMCLAIAGFATAGYAQSSAENLSASQAERQVLRDELFAALKAAPNEEAARVAENRIWEFWIDAPDEQGKQQLSEIFAARRNFDFDRALEIAEALITRLPDYSEAWNQKATVLFMKGELDASLEAVERTLELEPKHFGALAGKAIILMRQGRFQLGQAALRKAVEIYPLMKERSMLIEPPGTPI